MPHSTRIAALALTCVLAATGRAQLDTDNRIEAIVNQKVVTRFDVLEKFRQDKVDLTQFAESDQKLEFRRALRSMVLDVLTKEATAKAGVSISEEELLNRRTKQVEEFGNEDAFHGFLSDRGITEKQWDQEFRQQQETATWLRVVGGRGGGRLSRDLRPQFDISVTPREIREYYGDHLKDEFTYKNEAVVRVIQMRFSKVRRSPNAQSKVLQRISGLKAKLETKADFIVLAERSSEHTSSAQGGLLPPVEQGKGDILPEEIEQAVFAADVRAGEVIGPIEQVNSYWLVKIEEKKEARVIPFNEAQHAIRDLITQKKFSRAIRSVQLELVRDSYITPPDLKLELEGLLLASSR